LGLVDGSQYPQLRISLRVPDIQKLLEIISHLSILLIYNILAIG